MSEKIAESAERDGGGPAFPSTHERAPSYVGMSLRDWFAGQALAGLMAAHTTDGQWTATGAEHFAATSAYAAADAMLAERSK